MNSKCENLRESGPLHGHMTCVTSGHREILSIHDIGNNNHLVITVDCFVS